MPKKSCPFAELIPYPSLKAAPWKNGGGVTREIVVHPANSSFAAQDFNWRLSTAEIERPGPFSAFPDFHRLLTLVRGEALTLQFAAGQHQLGAREVFYFSGADAVTAALPKGPVADLGLLFDKDLVLAKFMHFRLDRRPRSFALTAPHVLLFCVSGEAFATLYPGEAGYRLATGDTLHISDWPEERIVQLDAGEGPAEFVAVEIAEMDVKSS